jgi:hypothetical protein
MHTLGKVLMFFVIVGALAGTYLAARLLDTRSGWMAKVEAGAVQYEKNTLDLVAAERRASERENEVNRLQFAYNRYWTAPNSAVVQGTTTVELGVGTNVADFGRVPNVHLFALDPQGASQYLGQFVIDQLDADRSGATLNRAPYPGETEQWPQGPMMFRVRAAIPSPWGEEFTELWSHYGSTVQNYDSEQGLLRRQQEALQAATAQLDERMQELQGHTDAAPDADVIERLGIVEAMRLAEIDRDATLEQLDALRREYSAKWRQLEALLESNRQRRESLNDVAQATPEQTSPVGLQAP